VAGIQINEIFLVKNKIWSSRVVRSEPQAWLQTTHPVRMEVDDIFKSTFFYQFRRPLSPR